MSPDDLVSAFEGACINGDLPKVQEALASGRLSAESLDDGLSLATSHAHVDIVTTLFQAGARKTPYAVGCLCGKEGYQDPRIIRLYFDRGLKPSKCITPAGEPLLRFYYAPCARELLERGVDPNRCGPKKIAPLTSALNKAFTDDGAVFNLLVEYGAKIDSSLFFNAIEWSRSNTEFKVKFLLAKGLDPNTTSETWGTPLHCAIRFTLVGVVRILLGAGADPTARPDCSPYRGKSPADVAESKIQQYTKHPSMQAKYRSILTLLADAQGGHEISQPKDQVATPTTALSEKPEENQREQSNMDAEHASNSVQANPEESITETATEPTAKKPKTRKQQNTVQETPEREGLTDSISSRTRSRTKVASN